MFERNIDQLALTHPQLGTWAATQARALTGNRTGDPILHFLRKVPMSRNTYIK